MRVYFLPSSEASVLLSLLKIIQVLQEQQPGGLLGIVKLGCATGFFPKNVINISKSLFEHGHLISTAWSLGSGRRTLAKQLLDAEVIYPLQISCNEDITAMYSKIQWCLMMPPIFAAERAWHGIDPRGAVCGYT